MQEYNAALREEGEVIEAVAPEPDVVEGATFLAAGHGDTYDIALVLAFLVASLMTARLFLCRTKIMYKKKLS